MELVLGEDNLWCIIKLSIPLDLYGKLNEKS